MIELWIDAWQKTLPQIDFSQRRGFISAELDTARSDGRLTLLAPDADDAPAGFMILAADAGRIDQLVVRRAEWGAGIAGRLIAEARRCCPDGLALIVNQDNPRALRFYARQGFLVIAEGANPTSGLGIYHMEWRPAPDGAAAPPVPGA